MKYPKIKSVFKRGEDFKFTKEWTSQVLSELQDFKWHCSEKLDGINIRIVCDLEKNSFQFFGRSDKAIIPQPLELVLSRTIHNIKNNLSAFSSTHSKQLVLFGEGFGNNIRKGGLYLGKNVDLNVFDCYAFISEEKGFWLNTEHLKELAGALKIKMTPELSPMNIREASEFVKKGFKSQHGTAIAEGLVLKSRYPLYDTFGERLIFKMKTKDF